MAYRSKPSSTHKRSAAQREPYSRSRQPPRQSYQRDRDNFRQPGSFNRRDRPQSNSGRHRRGLSSWSESDIAEGRLRALIGLDDLFDKHKLIPKSLFQPVAASDVFTAAEWIPPSGFIQCKEATGSVRSKLDDKDISVWKNLTRFTNLTGRVVPELRAKIDPELCTNAWAKMTELLVHFELLKDVGPKVRTVHTCEAPGGFIAATNHYLQQLHGDQLDFDWVGLTLNPYFEDNNPAEMVDDDAFILGTFSHWEFGKDDTGNIMKADNIRQLWQRAERLGPVHLYTSDGSVDCQHDPNQQEVIVAQLHYCEAVAGMGCLAPNGSMVLKMFTYFESSTLALLALLGPHFDKVWISKPACSRASNAETYVVCKGFLGIEQDLLERLLLHVDSEPILAPPELWPVVEEGEVGPDNVYLSVLGQDKFSSELLAHLEELAIYFATGFTKMIERNLALDVKKSKLEDNLIQEAKQDVARDFIRRYRLRRIPTSQRIVPRPHVKSLNTGDVVSDAHGTRRQRQVEGSTLADRQAARREYDVLRNRSQAASRAGTVGGTPLPGRVEVKSGSPDAEEGAVSGVVVDDGELPVKRAKMSNDDKDVDMGDKNDSEEEGALSDPAQQEAVATSGGFGARMLAKMGLEPGQGLGKDQQGQVAAIQVSEQFGNAGLGFDAHKVHDVHQGIPDTPWFERTDAPDPAAWILGPATLLTPDAVKEWSVVEAPLTALTLSKFCRSSVLYQLQEQRLDHLGPVQDALAKRSVEEQANAFASVELIQPLLAFRYPELGKVAFDHAAGVLLMAQLELMCHLIPPSEKPCCAIVARDTFLHGFKDFFAWRFAGNPASKIFVNADTSSALSTSDAIVPVKMAVDPESPLVLPDHSEGVDVVVAGVELDMTVAASDPFVEKHCRKELVEQVLLALAVCKKEGSCVLAVPDCFTRFTVGLLYVMHQLFAAVRLVQPFASRPLHLTRYLVCVGYVGDLPHITGLLQHVYDRLSALESQGAEVSVLSFVPTTLLLEKAFFRHLVQVNERLATRESAALQAMTDVVDLPSDASEHKALLEQALSFFPFQLAQYMGPPQFHHADFVPRLLARQEAYQVYKPKLKAGAVPEAVKGALTPPAVDAPSKDRPPTVPAPWVACWSESKAAWYFMNEETGETDWKMPE
eukprot:m.138820 g.138820  ORF g.138820 m.138820 type:complete len:1153 (+) comp16081_c0_seq1:65-3523(+)